MKLRLQNIWLCLPFLAVLAIDLALALLGQSSRYWGGQYSSVDECFPLFACAPSTHPLAFLALGLAWFLTFSFIVSALTAWGYSSPVRGSGGS